MQTLMPLVFWAARAGILLSETNGFSLLALNFTHETWSLKLETWTHLYCMWRLRFWCIASDANCQLYLVGRDIRTSWRLTVESSERSQAFSSCGNIDETRRKRCEHIMINCLQAQHIIKTGSNPCPQDSMRSNHRAVIQQVFFLPLISVSPMCLQRQAVWANAA